MKKLAIGLSVLLLLAIVIPVMAEPATVENDKEDCYIWTPFGFVDGTYQAVYTNNANEIGKATCSGVLPDPSLAPKSTYKDFEITCSFGGFWTDEANLVVTPSGNVKATCHFRI